MIAITGMYTYQKPVSELPILDRHLLSRFFSMDSFIETKNGFGLSNLPWGVFSRLGPQAQPQRSCVGVALGEFVVDVGVLVEAGLMAGPLLSQTGMECMGPGTSSLNKLMALGPPAWSEARATLQRLLSQHEGIMRDNSRLMGQALVHR